jgi:hypothetical protein
MRLCGSKELQGSNNNSRDTILVTGKKNTCFRSIVDIHILMSTVGQMYLYLLLILEKASSISVPLETL